MLKKDNTQPTIDIEQPKKLTLSVLCSSELNKTDENVQNIRHLFHVGFLQTCIVVCVEHHQDSR